MTNSGFEELPKKSCKLLCILRGRQRARALRLTTKMYKMAHDRTLYDFVFLYNFYKPIICIATINCSDVNMLWNEVSITLRIRAAIVCERVWGFCFTNRDTLGLSH